MPGSDRRRNQLRLVSLSAKSEASNACGNHKTRLRKGKTVSTEHQVFMKQLLENAEYANETGVLNVIKLLKHEDSDVTEGTSFAIGAFETLRKLLELRPDLLTPRVTQELEAMSQHNDERVRSVAQAVLGRR